MGETPRAFVGDRPVSRRRAARSRTATRTQDCYGGDMNTLHDTAGSPVACIAAPAATATHVAVDVSRCTLAKVFTDAGFTSAAALPSVRERHMARTLPCPLLPGADEADCIAYMPAPDNSANGVAVVRLQRFGPYRLVRMDGGRPILNAWIGSHTFVTLPVATSSARRRAQRLS